MIRRKKDQEEIMTPLSDNEDMEEIVLDDDIEEVSAESKPRKKNRGIKVPWGRKKANKKALNENVDEGLEGNESKAENTDSSDDDNYDPLNLEGEGKEYLKLEEEKTIPWKKIIIFGAIAIVLLGVIITFVIKNINSGSSRNVYVQSVAQLTGYGTANGGANRYTGVVEPQNSWKIQLDADMSVAKCYVKVGQEVKKGEQLFIYNTEELKLNQEKKELELSTLQNEINQLTKDISSYQKDLNGASASEKIELQTQILTAQTTIKKDQFSIKTAKEEITKIKKTIQDATVKSKMDGVVKAINTSLGESNKDEDNMNMDNPNEDNTTYMTILAVGDYRIKGKINETNANSIHEGEAVIIRSRTDDKTWTGTVENVKTDTTSDDTKSGGGDDYYDSDNQAESASNYNFFVELKDDEGLMMGQHVFVEPDYGQDEAKEGIWLAESYILMDGEDFYVWKDDGHGRLKKVKVEVGDYDEDMGEYQVLSGIKSTDYIACDDMDLKDGMKTTKVNPESEGGEEGNGEGYEDGEGYEGGDSNGMFEDDFDEDGGGIGDDVDDMNFDDGFAVEE